MYERPDVPKPSAHRTRTALIVLAVLVVCAAVGCALLWRLANERSTSTLGDDGLSVAVSEASATQPAAEGYAATGQVTENYLVLTVDDVKAERPVLASAQLLALDRAASESHLIDIPLDLAVGDDGQALSGLFSEAGEDACVAPLAQALGQPVAHVLELDGDGWDLVARTVASGASGIAQNGPELVSALKTDIPVGDLVGLPDSLSGMGLGSIEAVPLPVSAGADGSVTADKGALGELLGTLAKN